MKCTPKGEKKKKDPQTTVTLKLRQTNSPVGTMARMKLTIETRARHGHLTWGRIIEK